MLNQDNETTPAQLALGEGHSGNHKAAGSTAQSTTNQRRTGRLAARLWISRPDGHGLLCPRCQRLVRGGQL